MKLWNLLQRLLHETAHSTGGPGSVVVGRRDSLSRGRGFDSGRRIIPATTLGKLFTPNVPLFTKQYNLVPCEGLHAKAPYCGSGIGSNEQGEYCRAALKQFCQIAKNRDINHLLYFTARFGHSLVHTAHYGLW